MKLIFLDKNVYIIDKIRPLWDTMILVPDNWLEI